MYVSILLDIKTEGLRDVRATRIPLLEVVPIEEALNRRYDCDARLLPYYFEGETKTPRFTIEGLRSLRQYNATHPAEEQFKLRMGVVFLDIDPGTGAEHVATDEWRAETLDKLYGCALWPMGLALYHTRNGIRGVIRLPEPLDVEEGARWQRACWEYLNAIGVPAEEVSTWNLPYRAPFVRRDGEDLDLPHERLDDVGTLNYDALKQAREAVGLSPEPEAGKEEVDRLDLASQKAITENRNTTLFRIACKLRRMGFEGVEIYNALLSIDNERCKPPMQNEVGGRQEILSIARSAQTYKPEEVLVEHKGDLAAKLIQQGLLHEEAPVGSDVNFRRNDDLEVASWFLQATASNRSTLVHDQGALRKYRDGLWHEVTDGDILQTYSLLEGAHTVNVDRRGNEHLHPFKLFTKGPANLSRWLRGYCERRDFFSSAPIGAMFRDRFCRIDTSNRENPVTMEEPAPEHRALDRYDFDFIPNPETPLADEALYLLLKPKIDDPVDHEAKIRLWWEFLGICILGAATKLAKVVQKHGDGSNGKSTSIEMYESCFPSRLVTHVPPQHMRDDYKLAQLANSRLNSVEEMPKEELTDTNAFKAVVAGSGVVARHIYQAPISFRPRAGHVYSANILSAYHDLTHGFERRWLILTFEHRVADIIPEEKRRDFYGLWVAEQEKAHMVSKAVLAGIECLQRGGYIEPPSSIRARENWHRMSDQVFNFLEECCSIPKDDEEARKKGAAPSDLYTAYKMWARATEHGVLNRTNFNNRLKSLGYKQKRSSDARYWNIVLSKNLTGGMR